MSLDYILDEIKRKGAANREAIEVHRSIVAGKRGATGLFGKGKKTMQGICRPIRRSISAAEPLPLPNIGTVGTPLRCTGPKPNGDGYRRDRITGVITRA